MSEVVMGHREGRSLGSCVLLALTAGLALTACPSLDPGSSPEDQSRALRRIEVVVSVAGTEIGTALVVRGDDTGGNRVLDATRRVANLARDLRARVESGQELNQLDALREILGEARDMGLEIVAESAALSDVEKVTWTARIEEAETLVSLFL